MSRIARTGRGWLGAAMVSLAALAACGGERPESADRPEAAERAEGEAGDTATAGGGESRAGGATRVAEVRDLQGPESARYDAELDVWFVSNVNGGPAAKDNNGFISRLTPDGKVDSLRFVAGGRGGVTLHAPKGLAFVGDTLWVTDVDAIRGFDKRSGKPVATVDLKGRAKFLNDLAAGPEGELYASDTGVEFDSKGGSNHTGPDRIFRVAGRKATVAVEGDTLAGPNGVAWDSAGSRLLIASFLGKTIFAWKPGARAPEAIATGPGQQDGVEVVGGRILVTSWADSTLFAVENGRAVRVIGGLPSAADYGVDPRRGRVAVPMLMENRLEIWTLPAAAAAR
jgi:hypothetical protein